MKKLESKVAVITGGNSGMGLATARLFVQEGATVIVNARNDARLQESKTLEKEGIHVLKADVTKKEELQAMFKQIGDQFGKIDIIFANAGGGSVRPLELIDDELIDKTFNTNVKGVINTVQASLPYFNDKGSIILNSSVANVKGLPGFSIYAATKAAVRSLARSFTAELLPRGIRVNTISPGPIETPIFGKMDLSNEQQAGVAANMVGAIPMSRFGKSEEIAETALFLATDASSFISGAEIPVDGGMVQV